MQPMACHISSPIREFNSIFDFAGKFRLALISTGVHPHHSSRRGADSRAVTLAGVECRRSQCCRVHLQGALRMLDGQKLNSQFLIVGAIGVVVCIIFWYRNRSVPWLIGIGLFGYLVVSSLVVLVRNHLRH